MNQLFTKVLAFVLCAVLCFAAVGCAPVDLPAGGDVTDAPATDTPATDAPATDAPATDAPATDAPATDAPATDAPATDAPTTDAPTTDTPTTDAPTTDAPTTDAPTTDEPNDGGETVNYTPVTYESLGRKVRITCVGDSLTFGDKSSDNLTKSYPSVLLDLIGQDKCEITNCGKRSAFATKVYGTASYCYTAEWEQALESNPDIVIIMLGTNDANPYQKFGIEKESGKENYKNGMKFLIEQLESLESNPKIYICTSPWIADRAADFVSNLENHMVPVQYELAKELGFELIDVFKETASRPELYAEGLHFNDDGYAHIASVVYNALMT